jgi:hypothetical protein
MTGASQRADFDGDALLPVLQACCRFSTGPSWRSPVGRTQRVQRQREQASFGSHFASGDPRFGLITRSGGATVHASATDVQKRAA